MAQSVNLPTHTHGHILDWIIYRPDDNILVSSSVSNELTSDHFALLCSLDLRIPDPPSIKSSFRNIKCIDRHQLASEINLKLASIVNPTADTFHHCLRALLDKHSPVSSKLMQVCKCSPWYNSISDLLQDAKMKRRQAERHWLTSGLTVHKEIYVASKKTVTKIVHDAKLAYFSSKIADCTNCKQLFHVTDQLLGRHKSSPLPTTISLDCLPDKFSSYFHDKVAIIRNQLDCGTSHAPASPYNNGIEFHHTPFTSFQPITTDYLHSVVTKCAPKS